MGIIMNISPAARRALTAAVRAIGAKDTVVTVVRAAGERGEDLGWNVAFIRKDRIVVSDIVRIGKLSFYLDEQWIAELANTTIDFRDGRFLVTPDDP